MLLQNPQRNRLAPLKPIPLKPKAGGESPKTMTHAKSGQKLAPLANPKEGNDIQSGAEKARKLREHEERQKRQKLQEIKEVLREYTGSLERQQSQKEPFEYEEKRQRSYLPRRFEMKEVKLDHSRKLAMIRENELYMQQIDSQLSGLDSDTMPKVLTEVKSVIHLDNKAQGEQSTIQGVSKTTRKATLRGVGTGDRALFNEIFVMPKQQKLREIKDSMGQIKDDEAKKQEDIIKKYQEQEMKKYLIVEEVKPDEGLEKMREITKKPDNYEIYNKSLLKKSSMAALLGQRPTRETAMNKSMINEADLRKSVMETMSQSVLDEEVDSTILTADDKTIFQQQIQVEPPDLPNANSASPVAPGLGWAPSIPYIGEGGEDKANLKDLLMRAKAGKKAGEIQEEAHLNFCLALAYEDKKQPRKANYYYTDYFKSAKILDDKIGMAFARNRIGVNYHKMKKHDKSLENHKANIELSDIENIFAGYYNSGISLRNLKRPAEALEYFQRALEWSLSKQVGMLLR